MITLQSYVCGRWVAGAGRRVPLVNPATEESLAECGSGGFEPRAVLEHARARGLPALQELGFRGRAALLKRLAAALHAERDALIALAVANGGNTRGDAKFDIDGAIGTLGHYAELGAALPERNALADGEGVQLGRTPRWWGQHVLVPRQGVAVHVNAFNFPAWGMFEKLACALLAGVPVIEKPGTPTALLAFRMAQIAVGSGILPEGALQLVCGSLGDLLEHLESQDALAFTGSSATGAKLKGLPAFTQRNARVALECDSLNAALLGPDVEPGSETWNQFLTQVQTEMTQKAGQKCTAIRRVFAPSARAKEVEDELAASLARVKVGDPAEADVRMGPLVTAEALADVRAGIGKLAESARTACGGPQPIRPKGYFVAPTLLVRADASPSAADELEVFGPVASLVPYDNASPALVARGGGSLVTSIYSDDPAFALPFALAIAPYVGRVFHACEKLAGQAGTPGMVLPQTIHGGPGRAGGSEELGSLRGLALYLQRTALQGFQGYVATAVK